MASRCVVYMRASSPSQSTGDSFCRQMESCVKAAQVGGYYIKAVFADTCSGDGPMPSRSLAYIAAKQLDCPILVETHCRWSRKAVGADVLADVEVLVVGQASTDSPHMWQRIYRESLCIVDARRIEGS
jgi:DNA invertase Pin-like site-specific DNA recombinase